MRRCTHRRGSILVLAMCVTVVLGGLVIVFCHSMRVEIMASANQASAIQADEVEKAAEQYCMCMIDQAKNTSNSTPVTSIDMEQFFQNVPVGTTGFFWVCRPDYGDPSLPVFGLVDEQSKLNINSMPLESLQLLPAMTDFIGLPESIIDWRDTDTNASQNGAETSYYATLPTPYRAKDGPFESVEELLLVQGMTREYLYGTNPQPLGAAPTVFQSGGAIGSDPWLERGIYDLLTVYSKEPTNTNTGNNGGGNNRGGQPATPTVNGKVNLATAPRDVLLCLPGIGTAEADKLISARQGNVDTTTNQWITDAITQAKEQAIEPYITTQSYQYTADIVAVSADGRAFKHVRVVIDATNSPCVVLFRKDLTEKGWPMDPQLLLDLRHGAGVAMGRNSIRGGM